MAAKTFRELTANTAPASDRIIATQAPSGSAEPEKTTLAQLGGSLPFNLNVTGSVERTLAAKVREVVSVKDFGAVGDGVADDGDAVIAAIAEVYWRTQVGGHGNGGVVLVPAGVYQSSKQIVVPDRVRLVGEGTRTSELRPTTDYDDAASFIEMSNRVHGSAQNIFGTRLENLSVDMRDITDLTCVYSEEINEHCGFKHFTVRNLEHIGIHITPPSGEGYGPQNFGMDDVEIIFAGVFGEGNETSAGRGIKINCNGGGFQGFNRVNVIGKAATSVAWGIEIDHCAGFALNNMHLERLARGISLSTTVTCFGFVISNIEATPNVTAAVYMPGSIDTSGFSISGIRTSGIGIQDFRNLSGTNISSPVGLYAVGSQALGQRSIQLVAGNAAVPSRLQSLAIRDSIAAPTEIANFGQLYVDVADGDLKFKWANGAVATVGTKP